MIVMLLASSEVMSGWLGLTIRYYIDTIEETIFL